MLCAFLCFYASSFFSWKTQLICFPQDRFLFSSRPWPDRVPRRKKLFVSRLLPASKPLSHRTPTLSIPTLFGTTAPQTRPELRSTRNPFIVPSCNVIVDRFEVCLII